VTDLGAHDYAAGTEYTTLVRLVRLDPEGRLIDSQVIFAEAIAETIDTGGYNEGTAAHGPVSEP
jgi:hypothetical protein